MDAFKLADDVLYSGVQSVTQLITTPGLVNLDFADVRAVLSGVARSKDRLRLASPGRPGGAELRARAALRTHRRNPSAAPARLAALEYTQ